MFSAPLPSSFDAPASPAEPSGEITEGIVRQCLDLMLLIPRVMAICVSVPIAHHPRNAEAADRCRINPEYGGDGGAIADRLTPLLTAWQALNQGQPHNLQEIPHLLTPNPSHHHPQVYQLSDQPELGVIYHYPLGVTIWCEKKLKSHQRAILERWLHLLADYHILLDEMNRQQSELESLQQTLRRGKHQLREPLALIRLYAENLKFGLTDPTLQHQADVIRTTAAELSDNLKQLLDLHGKQSLHLSVTDVRQLILDVGQMLAPRLAGQGVKLAIAPGDLWLWVDQWKLKQVLEILLTNALEFSPVGSKITCHWRGLGERMQIEIRDQGVGIAPTVLPHIFEPFYSQRPGGTGLGLAIAADLVREHHGQLWAANSPEGGAVFTLELPHVPKNTAWGALGALQL